MTRLKLCFISNCIQGSSHTWDVLILDSTNDNSNQYNDNLIIEYQFYSKVYYTYSYYLKLLKIKGITWVLVS